MTIEDEVKELNLKSKLVAKLNRMSKKGMTLPKCCYCDKEVKPTDDFEYIVNGRERWMHVKYMENDRRA